MGSFSIKDPAASNGVSNLQRCRATGYLTLAAVAKCPIQPLVGFKHATRLVARGNKSSSTAIWKAGLSTPLIVWIELQLLPSWSCNLISHSFASDNFTLSILFAPNSSFSRIFVTVLYPALVDSLTPFFCRIYFFVNANTVSWPP